ncbi:hypothetical protein AX16_006557 [Volvariella volvacea WC 439]|nr:hypothetical protein AX16_006557 [Volvariella volvacea WC 439]
MSTDHHNVAVYTSILNLRYALAGAYAVQLYELFALLPLEWELMRGQRWSVMLAAYLWCRFYPLLVIPIIMVAYIRNYPAGHCGGLIIATNVLSIPFHLVPQAVMAMRAYAFTRRKGVFLVILLIFFAILAAIDIWTFSSHITPLPPSYYAWAGPGGTGCFPDHGTGAMHVRIGLVKVSNSPFLEGVTSSDPVISTCLAQLAEVTMDLVSFAVVVYYCRTLYRGTKGLATYFTKQGLMYFVSMFAINSACAIVYYQPNTMYDRIFLPFVLVIPSNIACRV